MHRIAYLFLSLVLVFAVSACESETSDEDNTTDTTTAEDTTETTDTTIAGDTVNADVNVGPAPCSPEAQGLSGDAVAFSMVPIPDGCEWNQDESVYYAEPTFSFATSEEEVLALFNCYDATPPLGVDFTQSRVAVLQGTHEHSSDAPYVNWVIESDGNLVVDITFEAYCSGVAPEILNYMAMVELPLGDTPVSGQVCYLPADEICGMLP